MVKQRGEAGQPYKVWLEPEVHELRDHLPGKVRQRIKREIAQLSVRPRPAKSIPLDTSDLPLSPLIEVRRLRLEKWRIVYALNEVESWVWVLALRERPPYDYEDLPRLVSKLTE
jgi:mRNA interferase RelE/StbE